MPAHTTITSGCVIRGTVKTTDHVRVDGEVVGEVVAARVAVGTSGRIEGSLSAKDVTIAGRVDGDASADRFLEVAESAEVAGTVTCSRLIVEPGATINARVSMQRETIRSEDVPALEIVPTP